MNKPKIGIASFAVALAATVFCATGASAMTVTSTGESGACTLRAAINAAATNDSGTPCGPPVSGGITPILLPANTYTPFDGPLVVPSPANIEIIGDNVNNPLTTKIDGTGGVLGRVLTVNSGASVKLTGLTVTGGRTADAPVSTNPNTYNPVDNGGGILNNGSLTIDHSVVEGNRTGDGSSGSAPAFNSRGGSGGPGGHGGGIYNSDTGNLTITDSRIRDNLTGNGGDGAPGADGFGAYGVNGSGKDGGNGAFGGSGGGIFNSNFGTLNIDRTTISGNDVGRGGHGGAGGRGAGPFTTTPPGGDHPIEFSGQNGGWGGNGGDGGKAYCRGCSNTFTDQPLGGGGVYNLGYFTLTNSTVSGNTTGAGGNGGPSGPGGLRNTGSSQFQTSGTAGFGGGGGRGAGLLNASWRQGRMWLTNVTITGNVAGDGGNGGGGGGGADNTLGGGPGGFGGDGGGIWGQGSHDNETLLTHVTVTKNFIGGRGLGGSSPDPTDVSTNGEKGRGAGLAAGGRYNPSGAGFYLRKTLIAQNGFPTNGDAQCFEHGAVGGTIDIVDQGYSLSWNGTECRTSLNADPDLGNLGSYGGTTETIVPQPGSPAIGGVPLAQCGAVTTDQRGFPRPGADGTSCDIGAVETGTGPSATSTTTNLNSSANPSASGQQVTYTATVSPPPSSGTVEFKDGGTTIPGCAVTPLTPGGQFTCAVTYPAAGSHSITASYSGNSLFLASSSSALSQTVQNSIPPPDTTAPDTMIDSGPSGTINQTEATFAFHGTPGDTAKLQCRLDSGAFADCTSPKTFSGLSGGGHTVAFRAVDAAGNPDASPATGSFTVNAGSPPPPPKASISKVTVSGPRKVDKGEKVSFTVSITNSGKAAATVVRLKVSGGGVDLGEPAGQVAAGKTKEVKARTKFNKAGRKRLTFKVSSANGGGKTARKTVLVKK